MCRQDSPARSRNRGASVTPGAVPGVAVVEPRQRRRAGIRPAPERLRGRRHPRRSPDGDGDGKNEVVVLRGVSAVAVGIFCALGDLDPVHGKLVEYELRRWKGEGDLELLGVTETVRPRQGRRRPHGRSWTASWGKRMGRRCARSGASDACSVRWIPGCEWRLSRLDFGRNPARRP